MLKNSMERHFFKMSVTVSYLAMELICENEDKRGKERILDLHQSH
jgi:hypothetical protein